MKINEKVVINYNEPRAHYQGLFGTIQSISNNHVRVLLETGEEEDFGLNMITIVRTDY